MRHVLSSAFVALVLVLAPIVPPASASAQATPTASPNSAAQPCPPQGRWLAGPGGAPQLAPGCPPGTAVPESGQALSAAARGPKATSSTGGPDDFGYTWNDGLPFSLIDATGGTDTGLFNSGYSGQIPLPFAFKYYENTYNQLTIGADGFLQFGNDLYYRDQSQLPSAGRPNNVIAPYWSPLRRNGSGPTGRVFYQSGGSTPNRYFVVEWNQLPSAEGLNDDGNFTFEAVLHENGDIDFEYGNMHYDSSHSYWCGVAGIEDALGLVGLNSLGFCNITPSNRAVRFHRPAPSARLKIFPAYQGALARPGEVVAFTVPVENTGDLGSDTYDVTYSSSWPVSLFAADGVTPLANTGGDSNPDTGPVAQASAVNIVVKVSVPGGATLGNSDVVNLTFQSSVNPAVSRSGVLRTSIPSTFAQVFTDWANGTQSLYLAAPQGHALTGATGPSHYGYDPAVAQAPNGDLVYAWVVNRCLDNNCNVRVDEVEYTILNAFGNIVRGTTKLANNGSATDNTFDYYPNIAVAPDGHIGLIWIRQLARYNGSTWQYNFNTFFAALDSAGNIAAGPANLTSNGQWFDYSQSGIDWMGSPTIAATGDNHFVLGWQRETYAGNGCSNWCYPDEILYASRTSGGAEVKAATLVASVSPGSDANYFGPGLTRLTGNRALFTFEQFGDAKFMVLDSSANVVQGATNISNDGYNQYDYDQDAVQLSDGNIVVAWTTSSGPSIRFAVLNAGYGLASGPTTIANPAAISGSDYVSVVADASGHAVLTWADSDYTVSRNLYYALVNGSGSVLTQPTIFYASSVFGDMNTSYVGAGSTSFSPTAGVDTWVQASSRVGAAPGGSGFLSITAGNHGTTTAHSVTITLTLPVSVTYLSDTSGISPTLAGNHVVWHLPDLSWLDTNPFEATLGIPNVPYGTQFPLGLAIRSSAPDVNNADNGASPNLFAAHQLFLPAAER